MVAPPVAAFPARAERWRDLAGGLCALAAALIFLTADTVGRVRHLEALRALDDIHAASPALAAGEASGYAHGERRLVLPGGTIDSYHEIMQAQQMLAGGPVRVREVAYDNPPQGREVHWAFPMRAWLGFLAWIRHAATGRPLGVAVEDAALVANPLLLAIFLGLTVPWISLRFGALAGALLAGGAVCCYPFYLNFSAGDAEHQGLAEALAFLTVVFLLVGWTTARRRAFLISGIIGGLGLWISTATEAPVLVGIGCGALLALWLVRPSNRAGNSPMPVLPECWRAWGWAGAGTSLAAYAFEYFPSHLGWRFEVNHPVYALAWAAGGEALCRFGRWVSASPGPERRSNLLAGIAAAAAVLGVGAVIMLTRRETFWVTDPFLWRLHNDYIAEFQSMRSYLVRRGFDLTAMARVLPLFLPAVALVYGLRRKTDPFLRSQLALALGPAVFASALAVGEIRWWGLASGLAIAGTLPFLAALRNQETRATRLGWGLACVLLLAPGGVDAIRLLATNDAYSREEVEALAERDLAHWLREESGPRLPVVLSTPSFTTGLIFHGGFSGVGTLYWENRAGLRTAAAIFDADTVEQARDLIRATGVTHIILVTWDPFLGNYLRLARGLTPSEIPSFHAFTACLVGQVPLPIWLHRLNYSLPKHPALVGQTVVVFEVDSMAQ